VATSDSVVLEALLRLRDELANASRHSAAHEWPSHQAWYVELRELLARSFGEHHWPFQRFRSISWEAAPPEGRQLRLTDRARYQDQYAVADKAVFDRAVLSCTHLINDVINALPELLAERRRKSPVSDLDNLRWQFLKTLYDATNADVSGQTTAHQIKIQQALGIDTATADRIAQYLKAKGWLVYGASGPQLHLTANGVDVHEQASRSGQFPPGLAPTINILHAGNITGTQIQQGANHSSQWQQHNTDARILELVAALREADINPQARAQLDGVIDVVEELARAREPDTGKLKKLLGSAKAILEGAGGTLLAERIGNMIGWL
jgi:hypothetical protein